MPTPKKPVGAKVKRGAINHKKASDQITLYAATCTQGATCAAVTGSTVCNAALTGLTAATAAAKAALTSHGALLLSYRTSAKTLSDALAALGKAGTTYMNAVDDVAQGNPTVITNAGLVSRDGVTRVTSAAVPENVHSEVGKASMEAILGWDVAAGAGAYRLRVNFTPTDPTKWQELSSGTSRRRTVTAPTPGAQFLASVASIGSEAPSDWSAPVMVTAR